jgi:hypothetical protein
MPNVLIHTASELKAETRVALEPELGRVLQDDEEVSIMAFVPHAGSSSKFCSSFASCLRISSRGAAVNPLLTANLFGCLASSRGPDLLDRSGSAVVLAARIERE